MPEGDDWPIDDEGYRVRPDGIRFWPGLGPQPDRMGMSDETARHILEVMSGRPR